MITKQDLSIDSDGDKVGHSDPGWFWDFNHYED